MTTMDKKNASGHIERIADARLSNEMLDEKHQIDLDAARQLQAGYVPGSDAEKALVRKLDWRLVPTCWTMYLLSNIDRSNIG
jgi:hypothetical protein